jgi:DNA polymerase III subunit chi
MSGELWFYHLERTELEAALAPLLEKCVERGWRALVRGAIEERLDALDAALWSFKDDSFLAHGRAGRDEAERQPIFLTGGEGNPNAAQAQFLIDGAEPGDLAAFERTIMLFDGRDEAMVGIARSRWAEAKRTGAAVSYWRQGDSGRWEKQA